METGRGGVEGNRVLAAVLLAEHPLELDDLGARRDPSGAQRCDDGIDLGLLDRRPAEGDEAFQLILLMHHLKGWVYPKKYIS